MPFFDLGGRDADALAASWRAARPFPHVVLDELVAPARLQALREAVSRQPHYPDTSDLHEFMASPLPVGQPLLLDFAAELGAPATLELLGRVTGKRVTTVQMRSYVYLAGSFLLPHSDHRPGLGRALAYAYYLVGAESCRGGELELFDCTVEGDEVNATPAKVIEPLANRLVVFDVSLVSLHQVREVTGGGRASLAGWYFP
jgi:Rps23 Pro-64 3,4-dihydroxylase Tpa1-like proline 4-hydroxylase